MKNLIGWLVIFIPFIGIFSLFINKTAWNKVDKNNFFSSALIVYHTITTEVIFITLLFF